MLSTILDNIGIVIVSVMEKFNIFTLICENTNVKTLYLASTICLVGITIINDRFLVSDLRSRILDMQVDYDLLKYRKDKEFEKSEGELNRLNRRLVEDIKVLNLESDEFRPKIRALKKGIDRLYCMSKQYVSSYSMERRYAFLKGEILLLNKLSVETEE